MKCTNSRNRSVVHPCTPRLWGEKMLTVLFLITWFHLSSVDNHSLDLLRVSPTHTEPFHSIRRFDHDLVLKLDWISFDTFSFDWKELSKSSYLDEKRWTWTETTMAFRRRLPSTSRFNVFGQCLVWNYNFPALSICTCVEQTANSTEAQRTRYSWETLVEWNFFFFFFFAFLSFIF